MVHQIGGGTFSKRKRGALAGASWRRRPRPSCRCTTSLWPLTSVIGNERKEKSVFSSLTCVTTPRIIQTLFTPAGASHADGGGRQVADTARFLLFFFFSSFHTVVAVGARASWGPLRPELPFTHLNSLSVQLMNRSSLSTSKPLGVCSAHTRHHDTNSRRRGSS